MGRIVFVVRGDTHLLHEQPGINHQHKQVRTRMNKRKEGKIRKRILLSISRGINIPEGLLSLCFVITSSALALEKEMEESDKGDSTHVVL